MTMRIALGADPLGLLLKNEIAGLLRGRTIEIQDFGVSAGQAVDYPDIAEKVKRVIADGPFNRGILICGTGVGMAIFANKAQGIRAAVVHDSYSVERPRKSNDAQILTMGALVIGAQVARHLYRFGSSRSFKVETRLAKWQRSVT
jgi:ribose 5-phosphate isomerase B